MPPFILFPALDLRNGHIVRLTQGDPNRQKTYSLDPLQVAEEMLLAGAKWLHVVNLDGAFGSPSSTINHEVLQGIIQIANHHHAHVQYGGGLHSLEQIDQTLMMGTSRIILGSLAINKPEIVPILLQRYEKDQIAVSLDGLNNQAMVSGWQEESKSEVMELAELFDSMGLKWLVYTDIQRDGMQSGSDLETTISLTNKTGLNIIASGGISSKGEIVTLAKHGVAGAIIGRALYEGTLNLSELLTLSTKGGG